MSPMTLDQLPANVKMFGPKGGVGVNRADVRNSLRSGFTFSRPGQVEPPDAKATRELFAAYFAHVDALEVAAATAARPKAVEPEPIKAASKK